jgi:hypothetical protein
MVAAQEDHDLTGGGRAAGDCVVTLDGHDQRLHEGTGGQAEEADDLFDGLGAGGGPDLVDREVDR